MLLDFARSLPLLLVVAGPALAERVTTRDALDRLEEILEMRQEDGLLDTREVVPTILVSATPKYEESKGWYTARALTALTRAFGRGSIRACEACLGPRTTVREGRLEQTSGPVRLDEIILLDDRYRGDSARARTATWIDESARGVSIRIVDLRSARVVFAQNVDPDLREHRRTARTFRLSAELERRTRGDSLTHAFFDAVFYPGQHLSLEWVEQWGATNANLSGMVLALYDPVLGVGAAYHRALEWHSVTLGVAAILSIPTAVAQSQTDSSEDSELIDPLVTAVFVMRYPFGDSNYAGLLTASTNGEVGFGFSLLNTSLIPVLP